MFRREMAPSSGETNIKYAKEGTTIRKQASLLHNRIYFYLFIYLRIYYLFIFVRKENPSQNIWPNMRERAAAEEIL